MIYFLYFSLLEVTLNIQLASPSSICLSLIFDLLVESLLPDKLLLRISLLSFEVPSLVERAYVVPAERSVFSDLVSNSSSVYEDLPFLLFCLLWEEISDYLSILSSKIYFYSLFLSMLWFPALLLNDAEFCSWFSRAVTASCLALSCAYLGSGFLD